MKIIIHKNCPFFSHLKKSLCKGVTGRALILGLAMITGTRAIPGREGAITLNHDTDCIRHQL